jgi:hypothetical protein
MPADSMDPHFSFGVDQRCDGRVAAQPVQAAAASGPDASYRDTQPGADLGVRHGRILDQGADELLIARGQAGEGLAECSVALRRDQFLVRQPSLIVRDDLGVQRIPGSAGPADRAQDPQAFPPGRGGQPAWQCGRIPDFV